MPITTLPGNSALRPIRRKAVESLLPAVSMGLQQQTQTLEGWRQRLRRHFTGFEKTLFITMREIAHAIAPWATFDKI